VRESIQGEEVIAFAVGGTGGHVLPALQIARKLPGQGKRILIGVGICENPFVSKNEFKLFNVLGKNFSGGLFSGALHIFKGAKQAIKILKKEEVTHVIGMGGFHSLPVLMAAVFLRIPITLYEPNLIPGKVNRFFSFFSKRTLILFNEVSHHLYGQVKLLHLSQNPQDLKQIPSKHLLRREFGLDEDVTTLLIFGGSKGAASINTLLNDILSSLETKIQVIHLTGLHEGVKEVYEKAGVKAFVTSFFKEMDRAWQAADVAICRAGAGTIKEALVSKTPTLLIPYPHAVNNHQEFNAIFMQNVVGAGKILLEKQISKEKVKALIEELLCIESRKKMEENIGRYLSNRKGDYIDEMLL
jgi:UDP-N-acetylglucosamine--N-acetylmuramyl-(pentapeptide) pyrophosphoryl-undecaprenol N-acetylglucosamine transferase